MIVRTCSIEIALIASVLAATMLFPPVVRAQWLDADGNPVFNPGDSTPVTPHFWYSPSTGILSLDTTGLNRTVDTDTGTMIGGDDVGFISMVVEGPEPTSFLLEGLQGTGGVGTNWTAQYFNGKFQLFAATVTEQYLMPIGTTDLAQYPTGLTQADFPGQVEIGINFAAGQPGATLFGCINYFCIPEPSTLWLLAMPLLSWVGFVRR